MGSLALGHLTILWEEASRRQLMDEIIRLNLENKQLREDKRKLQEKPDPWKGKCPPYGDCSSAWYD